MARTGSRYRYNVSETNPISPKQIPPASAIDQIYENHRRTNGVNGRITWTEPLGNVKRGNFITIAYSGNYRRSRASKLVYDITRDSTAMPAPGINDVMASMMSDAGFRSLVRAYYGNDALTTSGVVLASILDYELGPELERTFNESLSNRFSNTYYDQAVQVGFRKVNKNYNLNVGFTVNPWPDLFDIRETTKIDVFDLMTREFVRRVKANSII